jgi:hypothetical protein
MVNDETLRLSRYNAPGRMTKSIGANGSCITSIEVWEGHRIALAFVLGAKLRDVTEDIARHLGRPK